MALFSAVLSLFRVNETSSSQEEDEAERIIESQPTKAHVLPEQSPNLLQKLNRMHGNSVILNDAGGLSHMQECGNSKKRPREFSPDEDEDKNVLSSQKKRRVYVSASDEISFLGNATSINPDNVGSSEYISSCSLALNENQGSLPDKDNMKKARMKITQEIELKSDARTILISSQTKTENGHCSDIALYNEKDVGTSMTDLILNNLEIVQKDERASTSKLTEIEDLPKVRSLDIKDPNVERDILSAVAETQIDEVPYKPSTSVQPESVEMESITATSENETQVTSSTIVNNGSTTISEDVNQTTPSYIDDNSCTTISEDENQATLHSIVINGSTCTMISEDVNPLTSSTILDDSKDGTDDIDNASDNQLVPDIICDEDKTVPDVICDEDKTVPDVICDEDKTVPDVICDEDKTIATQDNQLVTRKEDEVINEGNKSCYRKKGNSGDQVVDENNNDVSETCEEDEEKMQEQLIAKQLSEGVLTNAMLDQEKKLHQEHMEEEKEIVTKAMEEWETTIERQRFSRLQHLLQKSNVYSSFLLQRIEEQKAENEKKKIRETKKAEKAKMKEDDKELQQTVPDTKRGRKTKTKSTGYNITDYVDTEVLKKSSKESIVVPSLPSDNDDTKNFSIGHHSKETETSQVETHGYERPKLLTGGSLRDYQIEGVEWLKVLFENGVNGILADEMGLGKTVQCIAVIAYLIEKGVRGPFLITAPLSTLPNWLSEFKRFTPGICAVLYHGTPEERVHLRKKFSRLHGDTIKSFPVAITSYDIIMRDRKHLVKYMWKYLIVDEGHRIKNLKCKLIRELKAFPSANRLLLTGTPLQNNLSELWSLLNFLLPDIFNDLDSFQAWFDFSAISESGGDEKIIAQESEHHVLERLHAILTPFLLRRLKCDVSIDVPHKKEVFVYAPLTQKQKHWYQLLLDKTRLLKELKPDKEVTPSYTPNGRKRRSCSRRTNYKIFDSDKISYEDLAKLKQDEEDERNRKAELTVSSPATYERNVKFQNSMMMLRKACNHPYLLEYPLVPETQDYRIDEEVITSCGKTLILDQMLLELNRRGHKVLLFSQMTKLLDILQDFCYLRKYNFSRIDGSMNFEERQEQIEQFNDSDVFLFLLSTRAGGLGLNLTAADTVIIYDSDWNPQQDLQAQDRCHRIGQTKPVVVYRILTANTIDQRIVERANEKRKLEKMVIHKEKFKGKRDEKKVTTKEMMELLRSSDHVAAINSADITGTKVLSTEQLNKLLDRSDLLSGCSTSSENTKEENKLFKVIGISE